MFKVFPFQNRMLLMLAICSLLWVTSNGCGGEVTISMPGCEKCASERCLEQKDGRGKCVACLKDSDCRTDKNSTKKCNAKNQCVCGGDEDCSKGFRCAGNAGCVECRSDSHCPKDRPACIVNTCHTCKIGDIQACSPKGSNACTKGTQTCKANNTWGECKDWQICKSGEKCENEKCVVDCPEPVPCKDGEKKCLTSTSKLPGSYQLCVKNSKGCYEWSAEKTCADKEYCDKGECTPYNCPAPECKLDQTQCAGEDEFRICEKNPLGCLIWSTKKPCAAGSKCKEKIGSCRICVPKETQDCYSGPSATKGVGLCQSGKKVCADDGSKFGACAGEILPQKELCNGKDDDCDGQADEDFSTLGNACESGKGECKQKGKLICDKGGAKVICNAKAGTGTKELCDGKDNDCDGSVDEDFATLTKPCTAGKGLCTTTGKFICLADGKGVVCDAKPGTPKTEVCDGKDNDCDGSIDENLTQPCYDGPAGTKGKGTCKDGTQSCTAGKWGACQNSVKPTTESCDGKDNDCDGSVDENPSTGSLCTGGKKCSSGACKCLTGTDCSGTCRDTKTDRAHCGACGKACRTGQTCQAGVCKASCKKGETLCSGSCVNLRTNTAHCGRCGRACSRGSTCTSGRCQITCPTGRTACSNACYDLQTSTSHCGRCYNSCRRGKKCIKGLCDNCNPNPCKNGGRCTPETYGFTCSCSYPWNGTTCTVCGTKCSTRVSYYQRRFLGCLRGDATRQKYCTTWMNCWGPIYINATYGTITGPKPRGCP